MTETPNSKKSANPTLSLGRMVFQGTVAPKLEEVRGRVKEGVEDLRTDFRSAMNEQHLKDRVRLPFFVQEDDKAVFYCEFPGVAESEVGDVKFTPVEGDVKSLELSVSATLYTGAVRTYRIPLLKDNYRVRETSAKFTNGLLAISVPLVEKEPQEFRVSIS